MTDHQPLDLLRAAFSAAIKAVHPSTAVPPHLPDAPPHGRVIILAVGKAAGAMAAAAETHYRHSGLAPERLTGISLSRYGYGEPLRHLENLEGGHPKPDQNGVDATHRIMALAKSATAEDLVVFLVSGGGSALLTAPADGLTLEDKQALTDQLLAKSVPINAINTVRKHLSAVKGGRLARLCAPARQITLAISDVPGDDPAIIASGPSVPDATTVSDALNVLETYGIEPSTAVGRHLSGTTAKTPSDHDPAFKNLDYQIVARPNDALAAAATVLRSAGYIIEPLGDRIEGEARDIATHHAGYARELRTQGKPVALLSGGELTVTLRGNGRGGPNQEYALALALALDGAPDIHALAADTDGTDGGTGAATDPAGAVISPSTLTRAAAAGLDPRGYLERNDSTGFFERLGDLVAPGPTRTNVNDLRMILVDTPE